LRRSFARTVAVLIAFASASQGGEVFPYDLGVMLAKHQIPPRVAGKWLLLGCDSIVPVRIGLTKSGDPDNPYRITSSRKPQEPAGACGGGERIIVRNIDGVVPGALSLAVEDSLDDSTRSYRTSTDTANIVTTHPNNGLVVEFVSGISRQAIRSDEFESMRVYFAGDINHDGRIDFAIVWMSNYANRYDLFVSRKKKGVWGLDKEATITFTD